MDPLTFIAIFFCGVFLTAAMIFVPLIVGLFRWREVPGSDLLQNKKVFTDHDLLRALRIFESEWDTFFGYSREVHSATWSVKIRWVEDKHFQVPNHPDVYATGWVKDPSCIWVATRPDEDGHAQLHRTAFFHELVHIALYAEYGTFDADHEGDAEVAWQQAHHELVRVCKKRHASGDTALI